MSKSKHIHISLPEELVKELRAEAHRLDRSLSWLLGKSWKLSRHRFRELPTERGHNDAEA